MVLIPPDIGLRLRLQNELLPQPITPLREIPADLPGLKTGQVFSAHIQEVLPENTYRALVAGKSVTLSLPESVKSGDLLELVVVDRTPKTIIAQLAAQSGAAAETGTTAYPHATFSQAAQMISTLLAGEGEAPPAAPLNRGLPLLAQPPTSGADLVPVLNKAVAESGLFYEAHQAQWVAGKLPLSSLLQEPQGQMSAPQAQLAAQAEKLLLASLPAQGQPVAPGQVTAPAGKPALPGMLPEAQGQHVSLAQIAAYLGDEAASPERIKDIAMQIQAGDTSLASNIATAVREQSTESTRFHSGQQTSLAQPAASMPNELRPLVQQQLDAAGTQRLFWHGEVWPGQTMQWQVEWDGERNQNSNQSEPEPWSSTLRLATPRLGEVEATLRLGIGGVYIALTTPYDTSAADLRDGAPKLEQALAAAGVPLMGLTIKQIQEE
ncbi:MAG: flagellar hook-length control protein FliK [Sterolibacterium sp.]